MKDSICIKKKFSVVLLLLISSLFLSQNIFGQPKKVISDYTEYIVEKGDNLYSVARKFDVTFANLCDINNFPRDYSLKIGQKIKIPSKNYIAQGDRPLESKQTDNGDRPLEQKQEPKPPKKNTEEPLPPKKDNPAQQKPAAKPLPQQELKDNSPKKQDQPQRKYDTYTVQKGDTFWRIAKTNDITVDELKSLNNLTSEATLKVGQKLKIPVTIVDTAKTELPDLSEADPRKYSTKKGDSTLEWPVKNPKVTYIEGKVSGVQLSAAKNEAVTAIRAGTVSFIGNYRGYGQVVFVQSKTGQIYAYCGLGSIKVQKGQYIVFGDTVGTSGLDPISGTSSIKLMVFQKNQNIDPAKAPRG